MRLANDATRKLIEDFETYVGYVYDDARPMVGGKYREWAGEQVHGTLTIGYGHTNAAGNPQIYRGMRVSQAEADQILDSDLALVCAEVEKLVTVELTDDQFGALVSFQFNCGKLAGSTVLARVNAYRFDDVPAALMMYVNTHINGKLVRSRGLERRRAAECALWRASHVEIVPLQPGEHVAPELVANPTPPKSMAQSKTGWAAGGIGTGTIAEIWNQFQSLPSADVLDKVQHLLADPRVMILIGVIVLCWFIWMDRREKLHMEHV